MNTVDILVLVLLVLNGVIGAFRGFVWQAFRLGSLVLGFVLARRFGGDLAALAESWLSLDAVGTRVLSWVAILVGTYLLMSLVGHFLRRLIDRIRLSSVDRSLGFLLGGLKGAAFVALAFQVLVVFYVVLPDEVQLQLMGSPDGRVPRSQAFGIHREWLVDRLNRLVPPNVEQDVVDGMRQLQAR